MLRSSSDRLVMPTQQASDAVMTGRIPGQPASTPDRSAAPVAVHAVVLAGTHPWGRCPLDNAVARPLLPVANRPLIRYAIDWLEDARVRSVTVCANNHTPSVQDVLTGGAQLDLELGFYEDPMPRGPAGCLKDATRSDARQIVVLDGTIVPQIHLVELLTAHERSGAAMTLVVVRDPGAASWNPTLSPTGIYVINPEVLEHIPAKGYQDIKEALIPKLRTAGLHVNAFVADRQAPRVQEAGGYMAVNAWAVSQKVRSLPGSFGYLQIGDACVHESAQVDPTARFIGPVLIGPHARIGRDTTIVGPTSIGVGCTIEDGAVVSRSALWNNVHIETHAVIDRCIITHAQRVTARAYARGTLLLAKAESASVSPTETAHWPERKQRPQPAPRPRGTRRPEPWTMPEPALVR